jgi:hypothetical protein
MQNIDNCLHFETVDDLYGIANDEELIEKCAHFMDKYAFHLKYLFLRKDIQEIDDKNFITFAFGKSRYNNYIHFLLPDFMEICFKVFVSTDRQNWRLILNNENINRKSWN